MRYVVFIFVKNLVIICVPATKGKWILFLNHKDRKDVGGKHNALVHYVDASAPTHLVLSSATLSNEIFCGTFLIKNLVICVPTTLAKRIFFHNHMYKKVVGGKHNVLVHYVDDCAPNLSGVVLYNILLFIFFLIKILFFFPSTIAKWIAALKHQPTIYILLLLR